MLLRSPIHDNASPALQAMINKLPAPEQLYLVWAQRITNKARANARAKGGRHFWRAVAQATNVERVTATGAYVVCRHVAGAHKETGGVIKPKTARALTIPITEEAKRKRAGEFELGGRHLFVINKKGGGDTIGVLGYSEDGNFHPLYVLRTRVVQEPDPWFPTTSEMTRMGVEETTSMLDKAGIK